MKPRKGLVCAALTGLGMLLSGCSPERPAPTTSLAGATIDVCFSPRGGCTEAIVRELNAARRSVLVQAYSFTSRPIAQALVAAGGRGLRVEVILDRSNRTSQYSAATFLRNHGIDVRIDARHAIAHNKVMIVDEATVITGSFNFTKAAEEENAENLLIIRNEPRLAEKYVANFRAHREHAEPYHGAGEG